MMFAQLAPGNLLKIEIPQNPKAIVFHVKTYKCGISVGPPFQENHVWRSHPHQKDKHFFSEKVKREIPEVLWDSLVQVSSECEKMLSLDLMLSLYTAWLIGMPLTNGL
jgi:hypothetical protein